MLFKIPSVLNKLSYREGVRRCHHRCRPNLYSKWKKSPTYKVVFLANAESLWSQSKRISGWYDPPLTETGKIEARCAGQLLAREDFVFDVGFCSVLKRSRDTLCNLFQEMGLWIHVHQNYKLNCRHMGAFTGLWRADLDKKFGFTKVDDALDTFIGHPPLMTRDHLFFDSIRDDPRYEKLVANNNLPLAESVYLVRRRVIPFWLDTICTQIKLNQRVVVVASRSVLRVIVQHLDKLTDEQTLKLDFNRAVPFFYILDHNLEPLRGKSRQFLDNTVPVTLGDNVIACNHLG